MGEIYLHNLLRKEAMRRPGGSNIWPYLEWEHPYESGGGGKCDICFVRYVDRKPVPYAAFEIKGPWDASALTQGMRAKVREDIKKHSVKQLRGTTDRVERYSVIIVVGTPRDIDSWIQRLDPDLQDEGRCLSPGAGGQFQ
jgi:hypothetical protein